MIGEPNFIGGHVEDESFSCHFLRSHLQQHGGSSSSSNCGRYVVITMQMHVVTTHFLQSAFTNGGHGSFGRSVKQNRRWLSWLVAQFDIHRVTLIRSNPLAAFVNGEALFVVRPNDMFKHISR